MLVVGEDDGAGHELWDVDGFELAHRARTAMRLVGGLRSVVEVLLEPWETGQTLMTIEHTLLPPGLADQHRRGWAAIADQLAGELAAGAAGHPPA